MHGQRAAESTQVDSNYDAMVICTRFINILSADFATTSYYCSTTVIISDVDQALDL